MTTALFCISVLCFNIALTEWLVRHTFLRHLGSALLVIAVTAVTANLGIIPTSSEVYDGVFEYVAPVAIFLPLLRISLRGLARAGLPMLGSFSLGALGTFLAVPLAFWLVDLGDLLGKSRPILGGMFVGTYTGGSVNFNALALHYGIARDGSLFAGTVAVDNIITAVWMVVTLSIPRLFRSAEVTVEPLSKGGAPDEKGFLLAPRDLALLSGLAVSAVWVSGVLSESLATRGVGVPSVLILTTLALVLAQVPGISGLRGLETLGMFSVYLFLAVVGAYCDVSALGRIGDLGVGLFAVASLSVLFHGLFLFLIGRLFLNDWAVLAVASQANIGGPTSALALARSLSRNDLLLPAILVGSLGYGVGTYLGFLAAEYVL